MKIGLEKGKCYEINDWVFQVDGIDSSTVWGFGAKSDRIIGFTFFIIKDMNVTREVHINEYIGYIDLARQNMAFEYRQRLDQYEE